MQALGEAGIIWEETQAAMEDAVGFRNILAHRYGEVDDEIVYSIQHNDLPHFELLVESQPLVRTARLARRGVSHLFDLLFSENVTKYGYIGSISPRGLSLRGGSIRYARRRIRS